MPQCPQPRGSFIVHNILVFIQFSSWIENGYEAVRITIQLVRLEHELLVDRPLEKFNK